MSFVVCVEHGVAATFGRFDLIRLFARVSVHLLAFRLRLEAGRLSKKTSASNMSMYSLVVR